MFGRQNTKLVSVQPDTVAAGGVGYRSTRPVGRPFRIIGIALTCDSPGSLVYARFGWTTETGAGAVDGSNGQKILDPIGANANGMGPDYVPIVQGYVAISPLYYYVEEANASLWVEVSNQKGNPINVSAVFLIDTNPSIPQDNLLNSRPGQTQGVAGGQGGFPLPSPAPPGVAESGSIDPRQPTQ